ncbi:hypothetical protein WICPIJ_006643 [Wickerhamomyces pijperi]|uniref:C2H2-type domain-containing protein n=1 Tax=Wickerhamomyces pijperi TaxID=599730 RepID=A0A9P8Q412_WICPI|nr:hypothetical protein WICPIJ_006643 [Wickerhamomyces pijperi]
MTTFDQQLYNKLEFQQQVQQQHPVQQNQQQNLIPSLQLPNPLQGSSSSSSSNSYGNSSAGSVNYLQQSNSASNSQPQMQYQPQLQYQQQQPIQYQSPQQPITYQPQQQQSSQSQQPPSQTNGYYNLPPPSTSYWDLKYNGSSSNTSSNSTSNTPVTPNIAPVSMNTPIANPNSFNSPSVPSSTNLSTLSGTADPQYTFSNHQSIVLSTIPSTNSAQYSLPSINTLKTEIIPKSVTGTSKSKPRKKKQCPICQQHFSNLSTHKSIHLNPASRPFLCKYCNRGFARSNDLFRHNKRHWKENGLEEGTFKCPFSTVLNAKYHNVTSEEQPCHPTGVFSRCDTYKNHLKALHFQYPPGTKKLLRHKSFGNCKKCGMYFGNVQEWLDLHVSKGVCGFIYPEDNNEQATATDTQQETSPESSVTEKA